MNRGLVSVFLIILVAVTSSSLWAGDVIPKAAWKRPLGQPLANPGGRRPGIRRVGLWPTPGNGGRLES